MPGQRVSDELLRAASTLAVDAATVEVVEAWRAQGVPCVLLKGPSLAGWLYDNEIGYGDADLLVPPARAAAAERVLRELGYEPQAEPLDDEGVDRHARPWQRPRDRATVDLHRTLPGVPWAPPEVVWEALAGRVEPLVLLGHEVGVLDVPARAMLVALHAAHHVRGERKPLEHLSRALERVSDDEWTDAAELAVRLDAVERFSTGLRRQPHGVLVAERIGLPAEGLTGSVRSGEGPAPLVLGFERLSATHGLRARAGLVLREVFPSRAWMRFADAGARRGRAGLAGAYLRRLWRLVRYAAPSYRAWRRLR